MAKRTLKKDLQWAKNRPRIHALKNKAEKLPNFTEDTYRGIISDISKGRTTSSKELTSSEQGELIDHLAEITGEKKSHGQPYPGRPHNMDKKDSRADQLAKIEALLTIGGLPWSYADAIAKQMRLADKIAWVKDADLYKIITALRKKAQKEGWDLSGEQK